jgi:hypothetical protein
MPVLIPLVLQSLATLDEGARARGAACFADLAAAERTPLFAEVAAAQPGFVGPLVFHTYVGYYQDPRVLAAIGLEPRPPHPKGHVLEPGDFGLLDAVRRRGPIWRAT